MQSSGAWLADEHTEMKLPREIDAAAQTPTKRAKIMFSGLPPAWTNFESLMKDVVLPFWAGPGFLKERAHYCECMNLSGVPVLDVPLRSMVQARQIFVFTHAEQTGVLRGAGGDALDALDALLVRFSDDGDLSKGLAFSISPTGAVVSGVRDAYAHAFVLFALASAHRLSRDNKLGLAAEAIVSFVDEHLVDKQFGGLLDCYPAPSAAKLQNPLMHLLEAYLAMHEAWPDRGYLARAETIVRLFRDRLFRSHQGVLLERYAFDWSTPEPPAPSTFFEPGHQFEWAWLLQWYDRLSGTDHSEIADRLWRSAREKGLSPDGLCFDEVAFDSALTKKSHRLWPHAEGIKATLGRLKRGDSESEMILSAFLNAVSTVFLARPFPGGWMDRMDFDGNPLVDIVPASSLYHLYSAFVETSRSTVDCLTA
jgi:mannose-6-phosphate isomerase